MSEPTIATYRVRAHNYATDSANRIHSDEVAEQYGFRGGLVPGIADCAYLAWPLVELWGPEWLAGGWLDVRLEQPVYDGDEVEARVLGDASQGRVGIELRAPGGAVAARGEAGFGSRPGSLPPAPLAVGPDEPPDPKLPPEASALPAGLLLAPLESTLDLGAESRDWARRFSLDDERASRFETLVHPAFYPDWGNHILVANVDLGPWIHTASRTDFHAVPADGERVEVTGRVASSRQHRGHEMVSLEVHFRGDENRLLAALEHDAIVRPRRRAGA